MDSRLTPWTLALALVVACSGPFATAQRGAGYRHQGASRVAAHLRWLGEQVNLTDDQKAKLRPILFQEGRQIRTVRMDSSIPSDQKMNKVKEIHETFQPQINAILTPEQQEKYKQLEKEARDRHQRTKAADPDATPKQPAQSDGHADR
jgi:periplasmic protein CpxP/Spy